MSTELTIVTPGGAPAVALMSPEHARRAFDAWLMNQRSDNTRRAYATDFAQWRSWYLLRDLTLEQAAQLDQLVAYRDELKACNFSHATIARKLSVVRMALDAARDAGLIGYHAAHRLKGYHVSSISSRYALDDAAVRAILAQPDRQTRIGARDFAALLLVFTLGARVSEAANIRLGDFGRDRQHLVLTLHGKGDKVRKLPVPPHVVDALELSCWLDKRYDQQLSLDQAGALAPETPLFRPERGGGHHHATGRDRCISPITLWRIVKRHSARAGYDVTTHTLRHTAATKALSRTKDVARVASMLGHSQIETTMRYVRALDQLDESPIYAVRYDE